MAGKSGEFSILVMGEHAAGLLVCQNRQGRLHAKSYWETDLGAAPADGLKALLQSHHPAKAPLHLVIPRHEMTVRLLTLPTHSLDEVAGILRFSAEEYVPYAAEDLVIGQAILRKLDDGYSRVLAVFAHGDTVRRHANLLAGAGITPEKVLMSTACVVSAVHASRPGVEKFGVANLALGGVEFIAFDSSGAAMGRAVAVDHDWEAAAAGPGDGAFDELAMELRASLSAWRRESPDGEGVDRLYLCADAGAPEELAAQLYQELGVETVCFPMEERLATGLTALGGRVPLTALGGALAAIGEAACVVELSSPELVAMKRRAALKRKMLTWGSLAAAIIGVMGCHFAIAMYQRESYSAWLGRETAKLSAVAESVRAKDRNLRVLRERVDRTGSALELLARVSDLAPAEGLSLKRFKYDRVKDGLLTITGHVLNATEATQFSQRLREAGEKDAPLLSQARMGATKEIPLGGKMVQEFTIEIPFGAPQQPEGGPSASSTEDLPIE